MDLWRGSVDVPSLGGTTQTLHDLSLSTNAITPASSPSIVNHLKTNLSTSTLSFLSFLPPSKVPLYLAAGPSLHVTTTSPETVLFFQKFFLSSLTNPVDKSQDLQLQPQLGLLFRAINTTSPTPTNPGQNWGITELLIYGSLPSPIEPSATSAPTDLTTPPASSPPPEHPPIISIYALPLSSHLNFTPYLPLTPPTSPQFIAPDPQDILNPAISSAARKRRAETLDKLVEQKTKKPKFLALAALGANGLNSGASVGPQIPLEERKRKIRSEDIAAKATVTGGRGHLARTLFRAGSVTQPSSSSSSGGVRLMGGRKVEKKEKMASEIDSRNHENINRIILDEMRKRGMQDYRKSGLAVDEAEKEEFKGVFHHSAKAVLFALRREMACGELVKLERVRDVVRRLVNVFLDDSSIEMVKVKKEEDFEELGELGSVLTADVP